MATTPWVMRENSVFVAFSDPDGTPVSLDMCEFTRAIRLTGSADEIDTSSMCIPSTLLGQPKYSCVLALIWSVEMYEALEPLVGQELEFQYKADPTATKSWVWRGRFAFVPFGESELSAAIIPDMPVSVIGSPSLIVPTVI